MNPIQALYTVEQLRAVERAAMATLPPNTLMQRAGKSAASLALELLHSPEARVLALAGPGNNGGDAMEAAACLCQAGVDAHVLLFADPNALQGDARLALQRARDAGVPIHSPEKQSELLSQDWQLAIDGLFGIGLARPITGEMRQAVTAFNALPCARLALDIPSGLDADSGRVVGPDGIAVEASHTISFIGDKPGLHTGAARDHVGQLRVASLEVDAGLFPAAGAMLADVAAFASCLKPRRQDSHKGSYGDVFLLGGAHGMTGAPVLGARAALHCGAGRAHIGFIHPGLAADSGQPELMCRDAAALDLTHGVVVAGPGMGDSPAALEQLGRALSSPSPLVLDADALNLLSMEAGLRERARSRHAASIVTPHPLEAARLLGASAAQVQANRLQAARELAADLHAVVVLKGSGSVIARPDGYAAINPTGNPALATAGSGDVLAGMVGALLAQGWPAWEAALGAVWIHGAAADRLVANGVGPIGMVASELIPTVRVLLNELVAKAAAAPASI